MEYFGDRTWATLSTSLLTVLALWVAYIFVGMVEKFLITPMRLKRIMNRQGVQGPSAHLFVGNMPEVIRLQKASEEKDMKTGDYDIVARILPYHIQNCQAYGKIYLWWFGWEARITITDPDLIKEVLTKIHVFEKSQMLTRLGREVVGKGVLTTDGEEWALHRRIVNPSFHQEKLKMMIVEMVKSASSMADEWEKKVRDGGGHVELEVGDYMTNVTSDIIAQTAFGSSYKKGKKVFERLLALVNLTNQRNKQRFATIPGYSIIPMPLNIKIILTKLAVSKSLGEIIQSRKDMVKGANNAYGNDLLGLMLNAAMEEIAIKGGKVHFGMQSLIDNCKTFFLAGQETTSTLLTWTMMLLASHTTWQERACEEVIELDMILNETLRLFAIVPAQTRQTLMDVHLGELHIPKGLALYFRRLAIHHDPTLWGEDAHEFKPERFVDGIAKATKHPLALMPFSFGPRFCVG